VCSGLILASGDEGCAYGCEDIVDIDGQRLHGRDCCEGDQGNHQRIFDEVLTFFPLDQALHPGVEDTHFELHLRPFLNELPVHVCLGKGEHPWVLLALPAREKVAWWLCLRPGPSQRRPGLRLWM
jgi:hypothetical protein